jgi:DNA-binding NtrC family response regulator
MNSAAGAARPVFLVADSESVVRSVVQRFAERQGFEVISCLSGREAVDAARAHRADVALVDLRLPDLSGLEVCRVLRSACPECEIVLMSGAGDVDAAMEAIRLGARDYLQKPLDFAQLTAMLASRRAAAQHSAAAASATGFHGLRGDSASMRAVTATISRLAAYARVALITGETGTGKELAARAFHQCGARSGERFVTINCSAVVESLFESELFGHVRGAFTGAVADKAGLFEQAHRGTLFLDEIGELPLSMQAKLLRVLENGELLRVGGLTPRIVDVNIIAATNRDLRAEVAAGRFRQDLLFRINMIEIRLPPLRERREDVPALAQMFLEQFATRHNKAMTGFSPGSLDRLSQEEWPGNVRELRNVVERACMLAQGPIVRDGDLMLQSGPPVYRPARAPEPAVPATRRRPLAAIEREHLITTLNELHWNKARTAAALGISRRSLYRRLEKHGLELAATPGAAIGLSA